MSAEELLGLPLAEALERWRAAGQPDLELVWTADPRGGRQEGTPRLVRVRPGEWTVARFLDAVPQ